MCDTSDSTDTSSTSSCTSSDAFVIKCRKKYIPECNSYVYNEDTEECDDRYECYEPCRKKNFTNPDICVFRSIITPLSQLSAVNSKFMGPIEFRMRRKNKVVFLQWEPFSGTITTTGIAYMSLAQTICNMPPYTVYGVYNLEHNGLLRQAPVEISPQGVKSNVLFYINSDGTTTGVVANDSVIVKGGCVSWIVA